MAQTPARYRWRITYFAPSGWSNSRPITTPFCLIPMNQSG